MSPDAAFLEKSRFRQTGAIAFYAAIALVAGVLVWQAITARGIPEPLTQAHNSFSAILDIGVLVFREGLECILVLAAITASMTGLQQKYQSPVRRARASVLSRP